MLQHSVKIFLILSLGFVNSIDLASDLNADIPANFTYDLLDDKIVGGRPVTRIRNFPYQVAVLTNNLCGGTLVRYNWVVTAAHCTVGVRLSAFTIRAGSIYYYKGGSIAKVVRVVNHPRYRKSNYAYDIALLKLKNGYSKKLQRRHGIKAIPIANSFPTPSKVVKVSGFGTTSSGGSLPKTLRKVLIRVINKRRCNRNYGGALTRSMQCAGSLKGGRDSCQGDSGGPLVFKGRLVGVVSWGNGCALRRYPGVYTNVPLVRRWVRRYIN